MTGQVLAPDPDDNDFAEELDAMLSDGVAALKHRPAYHGPSNAIISGEFKNPNNWRFTGTVCLHKGDLCLGFYEVFRHVRDASCRRLIKNDALTRPIAEEEFSLWWQR